LKITPAGRHLWASGIKGRQYLYNCFVSGWEAESPLDHFDFTFMRLMEGGGVGANYSSRFLSNYPTVIKPLSVEIVCDPTHSDYETLDRKSTRLNSSHVKISYAVFCLKKKKQT